MSIDRRLQGENRGREKEVWDMKKSFFMYVGRSQCAADRQRWIFPNMSLTDQGNKDKPLKNKSKR